MDLHAYTQTDSCIVNGADLGYTKKIHWHGGSCYFGVYILKK